MPMPRIDPEKYYTAAEVAKFLGLSPDTLNRARCTAGPNAIPYSRFGRRIWYHGEDVLQSLARERRLSTSATAASADVASNSDSRK